MNKRNLAVFGIAIIVSCLANNRIPAQTTAESQTPTTVTADPITHDKTKAETKMLDAQTRMFDAQATYYKSSPWFTFLQNIIGFGTLAGTIFFGFRQIRVQREAQDSRLDADRDLLSKRLDADRDLQEKRARTDASLKAAEIAMNSPSTTLVKAKAQVLASLLGEFVPEFGQRLNRADLGGFGSWTIRVMELFKIVGDDPDKALVIAETFTTLFPDDDRNSGGKVTKLIAQLKEQRNNSN